jgi:WD40 repeat protein
MAGKNVRCPRCGVEIKIPTTAPNAVASKQQATSTKIACPNCNRALTVKDRSLLGKKVSCPKCKQPFVAGHTARPKASDIPGSQSDADLTSLFDEEFGAGAPVTPDPKDVDGYRLASSAPTSGPSPSLAAGLPTGRVGLIRQFGQTTVAERNYHPPLALSPDGRYLIAGANGGFVMWDSGTGKEIRPFPARDQKFAVKSIAFSPDGSRIAAVDRLVRMFDTATGRELWAASITSVEAAAFAPHANHLAVAAPTPCILDAASGQEISRVNVPSAMTRRIVGAAARSLSCIAFSANGGRMLTGHKDGVRLWDLQTGDLLHSYTSFWTGHSNITSQQSTLCVAFSPAGKLGLFGDSDGVDVYDLASHKHLKTVTCAEGPWLSTEKSSDVQSVAVSRDGTRALCGKGGFDQLKNGGTWYDTTLHVLDLVNDREIACFDHHDFEIQAVAFGPTNQLAASIAHHQVCLWELPSG